MNNDDKLKMLEEYLEERSNLNSQEYKIKYKDIPERLFRYQRINKDTLETLEKNEIYMNSSEQFNDPFDCRGVYFDENEFNIERNDNNRNVLNCEETNNFKIACFSECPNNLPMWGNYADNRKGMCVEYNFKNLGEDHQITKKLWPVIYRSEKYDITSSLKKLWEVASKEPSKIIHMIRDEDLMMLFLKNLFKHTSWEYEKEWRLIIPQQKEHNKELPITPTAIYAGDKCDPKDLDELKEISKKFSCELIQLKPTGYDNKDFIFEQKL